MITKLNPPTTRIAWSSLSTSDHLLDMSTRSHMTLACAGGGGGRGFFCARENLGRMFDPSFTARAAVGLLLLLLLFCCCCCCLTGRLAHAH